MSLDRANLKRRIQELGPWQYRYELAPGLLTQPVQDQHHEWNVRRRKMIFAALDAVLGPQGYASHSFLDVGCNAGLWSFELHKRGARRIRAFDGRAKNIEKCELVREVKGIPHEELEFRAGDAYQMERNYQPCDVVLCLGLLYHLSNPLEFIRQLGSVSRWFTLVDSNVHPDSGCLLAFRIENPALHHNSLEGASLLPTRTALVAMLRSAGFGTILVHTVPPWAPEKYRKGERVLLLAFRQEGPSLDMSPF